MLNLCKVWRLRWGKELVREELTTDLEFATVLTRGSQAWWRGTHDEAQAVAATFPADRVNGVLAPHVDPVVPERAPMPVRETKPFVKAPMIPRRRPVPVLRGVHVNAGEAYLELERRHLA